MSEQAIPADILVAASECADNVCCHEPAMTFRAACEHEIALALLAERRKHDLPTSPDLQAVAERVFADVQRAVLVEDAKQVIAKALQAAVEGERNRTKLLVSQWKRALKQGVLPDAPKQA